MTDVVLLERRDSILIIMINRPEARNAVNRAVTEALASALDELDSRPELAVGVITGAGGTFCAGMDLKAFLAGESVVLPGRGFAGICEAPPMKPCIAAVEGWALAGGFEIALSCDFIVAADDARFGLPEVKRSLVAAAGGLFRLPQRIAPGLAMEIAMTGDPLPAVDAHRYGLVNRLTAPGAALDGALALAATIAANGPLAIAATKRVMTESKTWPADELFARQREIVGPVFASDDAREGASAFAERRAPRWIGK